MYELSELLRVLRGLQVLRLRRMWRQLKLQELLGMREVRGGGGLREALRDHARLLERAGETVQAPGAADCLPPQALEPIVLPSVK